MKIEESAIGLRYEDASLESEDYRMHLLKSLAWTMDYRYECRM